MNRERVAWSMPVSCAMTYLVFSLASIARLNWSLRVFARFGVMPTLYGLRDCPSIIPTRLFVRGNRPDPPIPAGEVEEPPAPGAVPPDGLAVVYGNIPPSGGAASADRLDDQLGLDDDDRFDDRRGLGRGAAEDTGQVQHFCFLAFRLDAWTQGLTRCGVRTFASRCQSGHNWTLGRKPDFLHASNCVQKHPWMRNVLPRLDLVPASTFPVQTQEHTLSAGGRTAAASGSGALGDSRHRAAWFPLAVSTWSTIPAS